MSRLVLEKELGLIRRRLEAVEETLDEETLAEDKAALSETLKTTGKAGAFSLNPEDLGSDIEGLFVR